MKHIRFQRHPEHRNYRASPPVAGLVPWAFSPRTRSVGTRVFTKRSAREGVDGRPEPGQRDSRFCRPLYSRLTVSVLSVVLLVSLVGVGVTAATAATCASLSSPKFLLSADAYH